MTPATPASMPPPCLVLTEADPNVPGQSWKQISVGGPHAEVELKPQLRLRDCAVKKEKLKSLLTAMQTVN